MLPIYEAVLNDYDTGIYKISLVDCPAVESDFVYFDKQKQDVKFSIQDEEKKMVTGVIMRADFPIYRISPNIGEYYMKFSKETIKKMAEKMMKDNTFNNINLQHTDGTDVEEVNLVELFIKDTEKGISPKGFEDIEEGSLFATYQVNNEAVWNSIKDNTFKGFSLEGIFNLEIIKMKNEKNTKNKIMSLLNKILKQIVKLGSIETDKGELFWVGEADLQIGDELFYNTDEEEAVKVEDGEYTLKDGTVIVVKDGLVAEIKEADGEKETELDEDEKTEEKKEEKKAEELKEEDDETEKEGDKRFDEIKNELDELTKKYDELKKLVDELAKAPAAEPVVEEFENKVKNDGFIPAFGSRSKLVRN